MKHLKGFQFRFYSLQIRVSDEILVKFSEKICLNFVTASLAKNFLFIFKIKMNIFISEIYKQGFHNNSSKRIKILELFIIRSKIK